MDGWKRVAEQVKAQRLRRGYRRQEDLAVAAGVSSSTVSNLERGHHPRYDDHTIASVEAALGWASGAIERISQGLAPETESDPQLARLHILWPHLDAVGRRAALAVAEVLARR